MFTLSILFSWYSVIVMLNLMSPFIVICRPPPRDLHSFPTRRSSDLGVNRARGCIPGRAVEKVCHRLEVALSRQDQDRKSTRLNSSHRTISYAVFCLKKKNDQCLQSGLLMQWNSHVNFDVPVYHALLI